MYVKKTFKFFAFGLMAFILYNFASSYAEYMSNNFAYCPHMPDDDASWNEYISTQKGVRFLYPPDYTVSESTESIRIEKSGVGTDYTVITVKQEGIETTRKVPDKAPVSLSFSDWTDEKNDKFGWWSNSQKDQTIMALTPRYHDNMIFTDQNWWTWVYKYPSYQRLFLVADSGDLTFEPRPPFPKYEEYEKTNNLAGFNVARAKWDDAEKQRDKAYTLWLPSPQTQTQVRRVAHIAIATTTKFDHMSFFQYWMDHPSCDGPPFSISEEIASHVKFTENH